MRLVAETPKLEGFGERLRRLRKDRRLSQEAVAAAGVSTAHISRLESGARRPSMRVIRLLARQLGVTAEYLESGRELDSAGELELAVADAELTLRLGEGTGATEHSLRELLDGARELAETELALRATLALGLEAARREAFDETIELLAPLVEQGQIEPRSHQDAHLALARAYARSGRSAESVALLEDALARIGDGEAIEERMRFAAELGHALAEAGEIERASELLERLAEPPPADPYGRVRLQRLHARRELAEGRSGPALRRLRRAITSLETADDAIELARAHLRASEILLLSERAEPASKHLARAGRLLALGADGRDLDALRAAEVLCAVSRAKVETAASAG
ncbi:MAG: helix-turn-helix domain-containing protein [Gaiellaceae bacterium]